MRHGGGELRLSLRGLGGVLTGLICLGVGAGGCTSGDTGGGFDERCLGVVCDTPPESVCRGEVLVDFSGGRCNAGVCEFDESTIDCTESGQTCRDGACVSVEDPCAAVSCDSPPADDCDGAVAQHYPAEGSCAEGECSYEPQLEDCAVQGQICDAGSCVDGDPCSQVVCDSPPVAECDGNVAVTHAAEGTCSEGECSYAETRTDCQQTDEVCRDGACVGPCEGVVCDQPPPDACQDDIAFHYPTEGTCTNGECGYPAEQENCAAQGLRCQDGACFDPCEGVACDSPPEVSCEEGVAISYGVGTCSDGECSYEEIRDDCGARGFNCEAGACVDPCEGVVCDAPPASDCDSGVAVSFGGGTCVAGECIYEEARDDCRARGFNCEAGTCVDPCEGVVCDAPPQDRCDDEVAVNFDAGRCREGDCVYPEQRDDCAAGGLRCDAGACVDPCADVVCDTPPADTCEGEVAVTAQAGSCEDGDCSYPLRRVDCAATGLVCDAGACVDPCEGVTCDSPPANGCEEDTAVTYDNGRCDAGECLYPVRRVDCGATGLACDAGGCVDLCDGVVCDALPAPTCEGNVAVTVPDGVCERGECRYPQRRQNCGATGLSCENGACVDPCEEVQCEPPAARCEGQQVVSFVNPACVGGQCFFEREVVNCLLSGEICEAGACVADDPCDGVVCDAPPQAFCDGATAVSFDAAGNCDGGVCRYVEAQDNCAAQGFVCQLGSCVDPCDGVVCDAAPAPFCNGGFAVSFEAAGQCSGGRCNYAENREDCAGQGFRCEDGACADPCAGVSCETPPVSFCDAGTAVSFGAGSCTFGACSYAEQREDCAAQGLPCERGACVDPCAEVVCTTPPADRCDGATAVSFGAGVCGGGDCRYAEQLDDCAASGQVCQQGSCVDLCAGVTCDTPPAARCDGNDVVSFAAAGSCEDGECSYAEAGRVDCSASGQFCEAGACVGNDPCFGVICDAGQAPTCDGEVAVRFAGEGVCSSGECSYPELQRTDCAAADQVCDSGACVDPCIGVVCGPPPAPRCEGSVAVSFFAPGCNGGECIAEEANREDCAAQAGGLECRQGRCVDPCEDVSCEPIPAPFCRDGVAVGFGAGSCEAGACDFPEQLNDCAANGELCDAGRCLDPCDTVVCDAPPAAFCDGGTAVSFGGGQCDAGDCDYNEARTNCTEAGLVCEGGLCVDPCEGVVCDAAPADFCDGETAISFGLGSCEAGTCSYDQLADACADRGFVCEAGACVDPCGGVVCETPPAAFCDGDVSVTFSSPGSCEGGGCDYVESRSNCASSGDVCVDGACVAPDACDGVQCLAPPPAFCDGEVSVTFSVPGSCDGGECGYEETRVSCAVQDRICDAGDCVDPCAEVACNAPPAPFCNGSEAVSFGADGQCTAGECSYAQTTEDCAASGLSCDGGSCVDRCEGVTCDAPPAGFCAGGEAVSFADQGVCENGECNYASAREDCEAAGLECDAGSCVDPCESVVCNAPPAARCDGATAVSFGAGSCDGGSCNYPPSERDCAAEGLSCEAGACVDPCGGVVCDEAPAATCDEDTAVSFGAEGNCVDGECRYPEANREDCTAGGGFCAGGVCQAVDPCDGVTCDTPPLPRCEGDELVTFAGAGTCTAGECSYAEALRIACSDNGFSCIDGACADPCADVVCDTPPAPVCDGNTLTTFGAGVCDAGDCVYTPAETDCAAAGDVCESGACVDPCEGVVCDELPAAFCNGVVAVSFPDGVCEAGECRYPSNENNCESLGRVCQGGICVDPCDGVVCDARPAARCEQGVAVSFAAGICSGGDCSYAEQRSTCADAGLVCREGSCVDPCDGVVCDSPPEGFCEGDVLVGFGGGSCENGECSYQQSRFDCTSSDLSCEAGSCIDPCAEVVCNTPPADFCDGDGRPVTFEVTGSCSGGRCSYMETVGGCEDGLVCEGGACLDPCADVSCEAPADRCDGDTRVSLSNGRCEAGDCSFDEARENCGALPNGACRLGSCVDLCAEVECGPPAAPRCEGDTLIVSAPPVCTDGVCGAEESQTDCAQGGRVCRGGACVEPDPCDLVTCDTPPPAFCDGAFAVSFEAGVCNQGDCAYPEVRQNCDAAGLRCEGGACTDPCEGVVCDSPPADFCDGQSAVSHPEAVCERGECRYPPRVDPCFDRGLLCENAACVDACDGVVCDTPPPAVCDGDEVVAFQPAGTCEFGRCRYDELRGACPPDTVCENGGCLNPCAGVVCDTPPPSQCAGDVAVSAGAGSCDRGTCVYPPEAEDCAAQGLRCDAGACVQDCVIDGCQDRAAVCREGLAVSFSPGTCTPDGCEYIETTDDCGAQGLFCDAGTCVAADPCEEVVCDASAPPPGCEGDTVVEFLDGSGQCVDGACAYQVAQSQDCSLSGQVCRAGSCVDPCEGVLCEDPPLQLGCDGDVAVTPPVAGFCEAGNCIYPPETFDCSAIGQVCRSGACVDPCDGVACQPPPPAFCNGFDAVDFALSTCTADDCIYEEVRINCFEIGADCVDGACQDLCEGVVCDSPPPNRCDGDVLVFPAFGECQGGQCAYPTQRENCAAFGARCIDGACVDACELVDCSQPPPPRCDEGSAVSFEAGTCELGQCFYQEIEDDCAARGFGCEQGQCVDLCVDVVCGEPPPAVCEGTVQVEFGAGQCFAGQCEFPPLRSDCAAQGRVCNGGACVDPDPCLGRICDTPPVAFCEGAIAVGFEEAGVCTDGQCRYAEDRQDCAANAQDCVAGRCVDPCIGVRCETPPPPFCNGDQAIGFFTPGACQGGECSYERAEPIDCAAQGQRCEDGNCVDACLDVVCETPPPAFCDGREAVSFDPSGFCNAGECSYTEDERFDCAILGQFCEAGQCVAGDPCDGVQCDVAPPPVCLEGFAISFQDAGSCSAGECTHPIAGQEDCASQGLRCVDGQCVDRCAGVVCESPPPAFCDANSRVGFGAGSCVDGQCQYEEVVVDCGVTGQRCEDGQCVDACIGVVCDTPPPSRCDGAVAVSFDEAGVCDAGTCSYASEQEDCAATDQVCREGRCVDPCVGVVCETPPAPFCDGTTAVRFFDQGSCEAGVCRYQQLSDDCDAQGLGCDAGRCVDLCAGVVCPPPPPPFCEGGEAVFIEGGFCDRGECVRNEQREPCFEFGFECEAGLCVDPCNGVDCSADAPPACDGDILVTFQPGGGFCDRGRCEFFEANRRDCATEGRFCADGACRDQDPCVGVTCDTPPPPQCEGSTVVRFAEAGNCDAGDCRYAESSRLDCRSVGQICDAGSCVDPPDPCEGITCDEPPPPFCDGDVFVSFAQGVCVDGACRYAPINENCAESGGFCGGDRCVSFCEGVLCDTPPPPECDGDVAVSFAVPGTCDAGNCSYAEGSRTDCAANGQFCAFGTCQDFDPCENVVCDTPPPAFCDGDDAITPAPIGECLEGVCDFPPQRRERCAELGLSCIDGACVDLCEGITCDNPPQAFCADRTTLLSFGEGQCEAGDCRYAQRFEDCAAQGLECRDARCVRIGRPGDLVITEVMTQPTGAAPQLGQWFELHNPGAEAIDLLGLEAASQAGNFRVDAPLSIPAGGYLVFGALADPLFNGGVPVDFAWAPAVFGFEPFNDFLSVSLNGGGIDDVSWFDGEYPIDIGASMSLDPSQTSAQGNDLGSSWCAAPAPFLGGADLASPGVANPPCPDPCDGISCPDERQCDGGGVLLRTGGRCEEGACIYANEGFESCDAQGLICRDGVCVDPCVEVVCDTPPPPRCDGDSVVTFEAAGECAFGECSYAEAGRDDCAAQGQFCFEGSCQEIDPCQGVVCNTPPPPRCDGPDAVAFAALGVCEAGDCRYAEVAREFCPADNRECVNGSCVDPCEGVLCDTPPPAQCEGPEGRSVFLSPGLCSFGDCSYEQRFESCREQGLSCENGQCVPRAEEGMLVITEIMLSPLGSDPALGRWFEIVNLTPDPIQLEGLRVSAGSGGEFIVEGSHVLDFEERQLFAASADPAANGDLPPGAYVWDAGFDFNPLFDSLVLTLGEVLIDQVQWEDGLWPLEPGATLSLAPENHDAFTNDLPEAWCPGSTPWTGDHDDLGSPGAPNPQCIDPCQEVFCDPPAPRCEGDTLVQLVDGVCDRGECVYNEFREDCSAFGATCLDNQCVDRCQIITCDTPPAPRCEGDQVVTFDPQGACGGGECFYNEANRTDCAAQGQFCFEGSCQEFDPCQGVSCDTPTAPVCQGNTILFFGLPGTCSAGECNYQVVNERDCEVDGLGCEAGGCVDLCEGVVCDNPPPPFCQDDVFLERVAGGGQCHIGSCEYTPELIDCSETGQFCNGDRCSYAAAPGLLIITEIMHSPRGADAASGQWFELFNPNAAPVSLNNVEVRNASSGFFIFDGPAVPPGGYAVLGASADRGVNGDVEVDYAWGAGGFQLAPLFDELVLTLDGVELDAVSWLPGAFPDEPGASLSLDPEAFDVALNDLGENWCAGSTRYSANHADLGTPGASNPPCVDLCEGVICIPAPARCEGGAAITEVDGRCIAGECVFRDQVDDCDAQGLVCTDGQCADACEGVSCDTPPPPRCDGDVVVALEPAGTCVGGSCEYAEASRTDCATQNAFCFEGACVANDPCDGVVCDTPPPSECRAGDVAVTFEAAGTCEAGVCRYGEATQIDCAAVGQRCANGACFDPCAGVTCDAPPPSFCEGDIAQQFTGAGQCSDGSCSYTPTAVDCTLLNFVCIFGDCVDRPEPGALVVTEILRSPSDVAPDVPGPQWFEVTNVGAAPFEISGLRVETPASSFVVDAGEFIAPGQAYVFGPTEGVILGIPVDYAWPPEFRLNADLDSLTLSLAGVELDVVVWDGTFPDDRDRSMSLDPLSTDILANDDARNWCLGENPGPAGTQSTPALPNPPCPDPCEGIVCPESLEALCAGDEVVSFVNGRCEEGVCVHDEIRDDCAALDLICEAGVCVDACQGVVCDTPPAAACEGDTAVVYPPVGDCAGGECFYEAIREDCAANGERCDAGSCVDACQGVTCDNPPPATCEGNDAVSFQATGSCSAGTCSYPEISRSDCVAQGGFCFDGSCQVADPCEGVVCDSPPPPECIGDTAVSYEAAGTCAAGVCDYAAAFTEDCAAQGQVCEQATCVSRVAEGDLVITELMLRPTVAPGDLAQWFEITNPGPADVDISGMLVRSEVGSFVVPAGNSVTAGGTFVFAADEVFAGGVPAQLYWGIGVFGMLSDGGTVTLELGDVVVDSLDWTGGEFPIIEGASTSLDPSATDHLANDVASNWCSGLSVYAAGNPDLGSPGAQNPLCPDPCDGVVCDSPPAPRCADDSSLILFGNGSCEAGTCVYEESPPQACPESTPTCDAGACVDACQGVVCNSPPPPSCQGDTAVSFAVDGTCSLGECTYPVDSQDDCGSQGQFCEAGACVEADPCQGVTCDTPPPPFCEGESAHQPLPGGTCEAGVCSFPEAITDCTTLGQTCRDGACATVLEAGALIITELMLSPTDTPAIFGQWLELYNTSDNAVDIQGLVLVSNGGPHTVTESVVIQPGSHAVLGADPSTDVNGGVVLDYAWGLGGFVMIQGADFVSITLDGVELDAVVWDATFPSDAGASMSLDVSSYDFQANDFSTQWCAGRVPYGNPGDNDLGTPGRRNPPCDPGVAPTPGTLIISEIMVAPASAPPENGEWFELTNISAGTLDLSGVVVRDESLDSFTLPAGISLLAGARLVVAASADAGINGGISNVDVAWSAGAISLEDAGDALILEAGGFIVDRVAWDGGPNFPATAGAAMNLDPRSFSHISNDDGTNWCDATQPYGAGDGGSPGAPNEECPGAIDRCPLLDCSQVPAAACEGDVRVSFAGPGSCVGGACAFDETREDCAAQGLVCDAGACVDPCATVVCDTPPDDACEGDVVSAAVSPGTCEAGVCSYDFVAGEDCAASGRRCERGFCIGTPAPGDLVISEIMQNPSASNDATGEWFEVHNISDSALDLDGMVVREDDGDNETFTVTGMTLIRPGGFVVFGASQDRDANGDANVDYVWAGFSLSNSSDEIVLEFGGTILDAVAWDNGATFPDPNGASMSLSPERQDPDTNDAGIYWCEASVPFGAGDNGTPGDPNPPCGDCAGITCNDPPDASCEGEVLTSYNPAGTCLDGVCDYVATQTDCAAGGQVCDAGQGSCTAAAQLDACVADMEPGGCPDGGVCGATFDGGFGCAVEGKGACYSSGAFAYKLLGGDTLNIALDADLVALDVFFVDEGNGGAVMTFFDGAGTQVDAPLATNGDCLSGMGSSQSVTFSRPVRSIVVEATGEAWIDDFSVNPAP